MDEQTEVLTVKERIYIIWLKIRIFAGVVLWDVMIPFYLISVRLMHGCWLSKQAVYKAMNRTYLEHEYGGRENVLMIEAFYDAYVKPYEGEEPVVGGGCDAGNRYEL